MKTSNIIITAIVLFFFAISLTAMIEIRNEQDENNETNLTEKEFFIKKPYSVILIKGGDVEIKSGDKNKIFCSNDNNDYIIENDTLIVNADKKVRIITKEVKSISSESGNYTKLVDLNYGNISIKLKNKSILDLDECNFDTLYVKLENSSLNSISKNKVKYFYIESDNSRIFTFIKTKKCKIKYRNKSRVTIGKSEKLEVKDEDYSCYLNVR